MSQFEQLCFGVSSMQPMTTDATSGFCCNSGGIFLDTLKPREVPYEYLHHSICDLADLLAVGVHSVACQQRIDSSSADCRCDLADLALRARRFSNSAISYGRCWVPQMKEAHSRVTFIVNSY